MAYRLSHYPTRIVVHDPPCAARSLGALAITHHRGLILEAPDDTEIKLCIQCRPKVYVVVRVGVRVTGHVNGNGDRRHHQVEHFERTIKRKNQRPATLDGVHDVGDGHLDGWEEHGGCRDDDPKLSRWLKWLWQGDVGGTWAIGVMKEICGQCPVRVECLEQGVWGLETWGVWGGATRDERRAIKRMWLEQGRADDRPMRPINGMEVWRDRHQGLGIDRGHRDDQGVEHDRGSDVPDADGGDGRGFDPGAEEGTAAGEELYEVSAG